MALGEGWHSGKAIFPECNTRGRGALAKGNLHLTTTLDGVVCQKFEKSLPRVPCSSTRRRWPLPQVPRAGTQGRSLFPESHCSGTRGRTSSPSANKGTRGTIFYFFGPFFWGLPTLFKTPCLNLAYFWIFYYISLVFSFSQIFRHTSNLNYSYMKSYNLAIKKIIFMIFGVYWGCIQWLTWNVEHLVVVTWRTTYGKSASKLQKIRTKSENHETCRGVVLSHVEVVCNNWEDLEKVATPGA
jgi:hypothetical protein